MRFQATREDVLATCLALAERGYLAGTGGNVALRADDNHFAVTPSATDYYSMAAADICIVRLSDGKQVEGESSASVESGLHAGVLLARPECGASVHTHQPIASAHTLLGRPLEVHDEVHCALLGRTIPCVGYAPSGTEKLATRVARTIKPDTHAYLMRNHGVVCVGIDADEAMRRVAALESECAAFFLTRVVDNSMKLDAAVHALVIDTLESVDRMPHQSRESANPPDPPRERGVKSTASEIIERLRDAKERFRAKGLFGDEGDSLSMRIPGREELVLVFPDSNDVQTKPFRTEGNDAAGFHAAIYRSREDAGAVLTGRTQWSSALATIDTTIPVLFDEQARHIAKTGKPVVAGRNRRVLGALAGGGNIAIHGEQRVCIGTTPDRVVLNAELFEKCAKAFVVAYASGHRVQKVPAWERFVAGRRLRKDQKRAAESYAAGQVPQGMNAY
ncbi:MAG: class II aldolase/adducin family protein [Deltaproteobacteria bacterium]|nr:class II aldolase/adducin family protein [Deltaproteobacteria bacterium]MBW2687108.1 class II aldolase/adducin family protein [Deltaproteobacteria bacterium]